MVTSARTYRIAVIPGDGIGKETATEGLRVLEKVAAKFGFTLHLDLSDSLPGITTPSTAA
jgi:tartrate dehydrogenase/decarboxylase/D-malate dehydrogenase